MKKAITVLFISIVTLNSCTDVVRVNVPEAAPRLVVEASLDWEKGTNGSTQFITLTESAPFFGITSNSPVTTATVKVTNTSANQEFIFSHQGNGIYRTDSFLPILNDSYTLEISYDGETYRAEETLIPLADIDEVNESRTGGFDVEALEANIYFNDPVDEENFYLFRFEELGDILPQLLAIPDEFTNGNRMKVFFEKIDDEDTDEEAFVSGDVANMSFYGISKQYYNYMDLLIDQYENSQNPFGTVPASIKGNCVNITVPEHYAFGYFRVTQVEKVTYTFQ